MGHAGLIRAARPLCLALLLGACAANGDPALNTGFNQAAQAEIARRPTEYGNGEARAFLVVQDGRAIALLWGTTHLAYSTETIMPRPIRDRFDQATDLTVEFPLDRLPRARLAAMRGRLLADIVAPDPAALAGLDPATRSALEETDLPSELRGKLSLRGWTTILGARALQEPPGNLPQLGFVDLNLMGFARSRGIPVLGLENPEQTLGDLRIDPNGPAAAAGLRRLLRQRADAKAFRTWTLDTYARGEVGLLMAGLNAWRATPEDLKDADQQALRLFSVRDAAWLPRLEATLAQPGFHFIAFGAGHLIGADGLVALLRAKGFTVLPCRHDACPQPAPKP